MKTIPSWTGQVETAVLGCSECPGSRRTLWSESSSEHAIDVTENSAPLVTLHTVIKSQTRAMMLL